MSSASDAIPAPPPFFARSRTGPAVVLSEAPGRSPLPWGSVAVWVYRGIVLASILLGVVRMMNQQFVSRDLFLSEMHRLEQKIDALNR